MEHRSLKKRMHVFCRKVRHVLSQYIFAYRQILVSDNLTAGENTKTTWVTSRTAPPPRGLRSGTWCAVWSTVPEQRGTFCSASSIQPLKSLRLCWRQESSANMAFL